MNPGNGIRAARDRIAQAAAAKAPPSDRKLEGLAARLAHGRNLRHRTTWPGTDVAIAIAVLTQRERSESMAAAIVEIRRRGMDDGKPAPEHVEPAAVEHIVQILARAIRDPDTDARVFADAADLADVATEDEIAVLFTAYGEFRREVDPELTELPADEWQSFMLAVKKKELHRWSAIAFGWPRSWLLTSVDRLATSLTSNSPSTESDGEPLPLNQDEPDPRDPESSEP